MLENKYFSIRKPKFSGEGALATRDLPANTIYANYGGLPDMKMIYILLQDCMKK